MATKTVNKAFSLFVMSSEVSKQMHICAICQKPSYFASPFPKAPHLRKSWIMNTGISVRPDDTTTRICSIHFEDSQWTYRDDAGSKFKVLNKTAKPTLYLKECAPVPDPESYVPPKSRRITGKCAVCYCRIKIQQNTCAIFDDCDKYTEFGSVLAYILKLTSRRVSSRFCCQLCVSRVMACITDIIEINVSAMLTNRKFERAEQAATLEKLGEKSNIQDSTNEEKRVPDPNEDFLEKCILCNNLSKSREQLTQHLLTHLVRQRSVRRKSVGVTQTNLSDLDDSMDCFEGKEEVEEVKKNKEVVENYFSLDHDDQTIETLDDETKEEIQSGCIKAENTIVKIEEVKAGENLSKPSRQAKKHGARKRLRPHAKKKSKDSSICHLCGKELKTPESLKVHVNLHKDTDSGPHKCKKCHAVLKNSVSLRQHMNRLHLSPKKNYRACEKCGQLRGNLYQHRKNCLKSKLSTPARVSARVPCGVCGKMVAESYLTSHLRLHEIEDEVARLGPEAAEKYLKTCNTCGKKFRNLRLHMRQIHGVTEKVSVHECGQCQVAFRQKALLVNHMILKHGVDSKVFSRDRSHSWKTFWPCLICRKHFTSYNQIRRHVKAEHSGSGLALICESCGKQYNTLEALREHIKLKHLDYFSHYCPACHKPFATLKGLNEHLMKSCKAVVRENKVNEMSDVFEVPESLAGEVITDPVGQLVEDKMYFEEPLQEDGSVILYVPEHNSNYLVAE